MTVSTTRAMPLPHGTRREAGELPGTALSAELRFVLRTAAAALGGPPPRPEPDLDWAEVLACVRHHRLERLMEPALTPEAGVPQEVRAALAEAARGATLRTMLLASELARLARRFAAAGVELLAIKGPALSALLFGDPCRRPCRDLDLLVRPEDEAAARRILAGCGYGATPDRVIPHCNAVLLLHERHAVPVELHVRLAEDERVLSTRDLDPFGSAVEVEVAGTRVRTLGPEAALVYAAHHGARHHWFRLCWLADVAAATRLGGVDWQRVAGLARRTGTERQLALAARLSGALFGRPPAWLPPLDGRAAAGVRRAEALMPAILAPPLVEEVDMVRRVGGLRILLSELALLRRPAARWALLRTRLRPTATDEALVALPAGLGFVYYAVRLVRLGWAALWGYFRPCRRT